MKKQTFVPDLVHFDSLRVLVIDKVENLGEGGVL
jgi:hypothetical protein